MSLMCSPKEASLPTGTCASIVLKKERSLVANLGAALYYPTSQVEKI